MQGLGSKSRAANMRRRHETVASIEAWDTWCLVAPKAAALRKSVLDPPECCSTSRQIKGCKLQGCPEPLKPTGLISLSQTWQRPSRRYVGTSLKSPSIHMVHTTNSGKDTVNPLSPMHILWYYMNLLGLAPSPFWSPYKRSLLCRIEGQLHHEAVPVHPASGNRRPAQPRRVTVGDLSPASPNMYNTTRIPGVFVNLGT